jgi:hypothetical protein
MEPGYNSRSSHPVHHLSFPSLYFAMKTKNWCDDFPNQHFVVFIGISINSVQLAKIGDSRGYIRSGGKGPEDE